MNKVTIEVDWITISEAAKLFGRTRAAIEQHIKTGRVEAKRFGDKQLIHVYKPALQNLFASFAKSFSTKEQSDWAQSVMPNKDQNLQSDFAKELSFLYKNLLEDSKKEIQILKSELLKEREENKDLQKQIIKHVHEIQGLLKKDTGIMSWLRSK
jgi:predicted transcriptional regulator